MNSLASSASSGSSSTISWARLRNSLPARSSARDERDATICGSSNSSTIALPSAMRSGQNATSMSRPRSPTKRSTNAVTPGYTVLRSTSSWPSCSDGGDVGDRRRHRVEIRVEVLVDRGADDDDHVFHVADHVGRRARAQEPRRDQRGEQLRRTRLVEGHDAVVDQRDRALGDVVEHDLEPAAGEGEPERQADVPAPPDDRDSTASVGSGHRTRNSSGFRARCMREQRRRGRCAFRASQRARAVPRNRFPPCDTSRRAVRCEHQFDHFPTIRPGRLR